MAGFAFALALDANEIHVEMHIELCYSLSIEIQRISSDNYQSDSFSLGHVIVEILLQHSIYI